MSRKPKTALLVALLVLGCTFGLAGSLVEDECNTRLGVELLAQERDDRGIALQFEVTVSSARQCSTIAYDLVIDQILPNRQTKSVRKPRRVELENGALTEVVQHTMTADLELLSFEVQLVGCEGCAPEP